jgi:hypothetical protein
MIKIISGWSNPGGSTTAFINLVNAFNEAGYEAKFYGPHHWANNKTKYFEQIGSRKMILTSEDHVIFHFTNKVDKRLPVKTQIFSCHEQDIFPLKNINYSVFDKIHYVSEHQRLYHMIDHPYFILPNILDDLKESCKLNDKKIGGIIGSIDRNKRVDHSIKRALKDGCEKVLIYGMISDPWYWQKEVSPLVDGNKVVYMGYEDNKQKMYDSITDVYQDSKLETWGYIKGECKLTVTKYHGSKSTEGYWEMSKDDIIKNWVKEIRI